MDSILISPYSSKVNPGNMNAKNFPYWQELIDLLKDEYNIIQIGVKGENKFNNISKYCYDYKLSDLVAVLKESKFFISVDNFFHHFAHYHKKCGFVIFSKSDPELFGYKENINILKSKKYLRLYQFQ